MSETFHKIVDGVVTPLSTEETTALQSERAQWAAGADDRTAAEIRRERNNKLAETDWMGMSDVTMSTEWATYRQALRDVPAQAGFPNTITWPTEPE